MPQPMSTPTAAGMMAPRVAITVPTVDPLPACTSGITARCRWTNGSADSLRSWSNAASSMGTPRVQALIGTRVASTGRNTIGPRRSVSRNTVMSVLSCVYYTV